MNDTKPFKLVGDQIHWVMSNKKGYDIVAELNDGYLCVEDKQGSWPVRYIAKSQIDIPQDVTKL